MNISLKRQLNPNHTDCSITNKSGASKTSTEELEFDFDFDDIVSDANDDHTHEDRPYQWGTNIQFVNIDINNLSLKNRASNSFHHTHLHYHNAQKSNHAHRKPITLSNVNNDSQTVPHANHQHNHRHSTLIPFNRQQNSSLIKLTRQISTFAPKLYDICSVISCPLSIESTANIPLSSLEYIRSYLPDSNEFNDYLHDILHQSGYKLRVANYIGTVDNLSCMLNNGGSKILHFIAYIWNPMNTAQMAQNHPLSCTFPTHDEYYKCDTEYILIERSSFTQYGDNGKWIKVKDLQKMVKFDIHLNDIIITISPQSTQLCNVFRNVFGYKYVIGVQCESNNHNAFSSTETAIFLKYFYSSILHQECLDRAFELAKTAAVLQRTGAAIDCDSDKDTKYILLTENDNNSARFVAFPHLIEGKPLNVSPHTNYNLIKTNLRRIIRPFIGRASDVIRLIHNIIHHKASLVIGEENHGRAAVIHNTVRYLLQHLYFSACFVIDLEDKRNGRTLIGRLYDVLRDETEIECDEDDLSYETLFGKLNEDASFDSICIILLNTNEWKNAEEIFEFIQIFNSETNEKCRIILSSNIVSYNLHYINVDALNKEDVSKVFESYLIDKERYDIKNIISHKKLHHILNGSARIAKRVAEFVNSECANNKLTLEQIAAKYPSSAFAKAMKHKLSRVNIPHVQKSKKGTIPYAGWNKSVAQINDNNNNDSSSWELSRRCESFTLPAVPNDHDNRWNVSYSADTYRSSTDYDDTFIYSRNSRSSSDDSDTEQNLADGAIYSHTSGFLAIKNISITTPRDHRLTGAGLRKRLSPRAHRRHNTYSIPDFCTEITTDDTMTNIFSTNCEQIPEAAEEEYTIENNNRVLYNLLNNIDPNDHDSDDSLSFPDISKINLNRNPFSNKLISSQKSDASTITSYQPTRNMHKDSKKHYKKIESMDFDGLSTFTTSTKQLAARHHTKQLNLYNNTSYQVQQRVNSVTKSSECTEYGYGYPEYTEYDSCTDTIDATSKPLQLSPKDSGEPVVELHLAKICAANITAAGYNSGSDDTFHTESSETHHIPMTPVAAVDIDSDTIVEDVEDIITKKGSVVVQHAQRSSTISLSADEINIIKDADAKAIWRRAASHYNQYTYLYKLYPYLVKKFQVTTGTKHRFPQIQELEHYFLKMGGKYLRNTNFPVIHITKYNKFYGWFTFMCSIVSDLRQIYDDYNLECLFYGKRTSSEILKMRPQGTFVLSLTNKVNCVSIKYKKTHKSKEVSSILLMRHAKNLYSVIKNTAADNQNIAAASSLYQIIRPRTYLKYLYTPQMLIDKKALF